MVQATTPTFILKVPESVDLTEAQNVYFTLAQGSSSMTKTGESITVTSHQVDVYLSQSDTVGLSVGNAALQLNWVYSDGSRACTNIVSVNISANLLKEVIE